MESQIHDLLIIGGGINGAGIARDAAGRGLSVALCEMGDLGGGASSASSKLIHGGLRYLEYYEFRLVREALAEREVLLAIAPHLVRPLKFVLPLLNTIRPAWLVRLGLFIYDHLGPHPSLPNSSSVNLRKADAGAPLRDNIAKGFTYHDCRVDDARLVVLNAMDAARRGARIMTGAKLISARREGDAWRADIVHREGQEEILNARTMVNAAGPWVEQVLTAASDSDMRNRKTVLIKGSHIVVPRLYDGEHAYILQHDDRRVIFVIPYERHYSLIGTTDVAFEGDPGAAGISNDEIGYLCRAVNAYFQGHVTPDQVCWSFAGIRPLFSDGHDDPSAVTRDYVLEQETGPGRDQAPLLSVYGGKITTYRRLAEAVLAELAPLFPNLSNDWTASTPLPGGDMAPDEVVAALRADYPDLPDDLINGLVGRHGTLARDILGVAKTTTDLGRNFGAGLTGQEIDYLVANEWARTAEDILWRRTKCGLHLTPEQRQSVADYLGQRRQHLLDRANDE